MNWSWLDSLDVKLGWRMLRKSPGITIVGGLGIAVAVAIGTGFFIVLDSYLDPTLPIDEGDRVVVIDNWDLAETEHVRATRHDFATWREQVTTVRQLSAFRNVRAQLVTGKTVPSRIDVAQMSASGFQVARTAPLMGRTINDADERAGATPVIVLSHQVWKRSFESDPQVIGKDVLLGDVRHVVIGIMPDGFAFPRNHNAWVALREDDASQARDLFVFGRLAPGVTAEQVHAELDVVGQRLAAAATERSTLRPQLRRYTHALDDLGANTLREAGLLRYLTTIVLVAVALNVAVLVYARTATRRGELALRSAIGAGRGRIVLQLFMEALVLSTIASALGLAIARFVLGRAQVFLTESMDAAAYWTDWSIRPATILYALALALLTAVIVGVLPALQSTGKKLQADLRQLGGATGIRLGRTWTLLIVTQVAVAVAVLPPALNDAWNELRFIANKPTYPAHEFLVAQIGLVSEVEPNVDAQTWRTATGQKFADRLGELMQRLRRDGAIADLTFAAGAYDRSGLLEVEGVPAPPYSPQGHWVVSTVADTSYVRVFGGRLLSGRSFESADLTESGNAVLVDRSFVRQVLGGGSALGKRVRRLNPNVAPELRADSASQWYEIVGVVDDLMVNPLDEGSVRATMYSPVNAATLQHGTLLLHVRAGDPESFIPKLRGHLAATDRSLQLIGADSMGLPHSWWRFLLALFGLSDGLSAPVRTAVLVAAIVLASVILLSAAGIHALMSFTVTQRRKEIAIRAALGAEPRRVLGSVLIRATAQLAVGAMLGCALAAYFLDGHATTTRITMLLLFVTTLMLSAGMIAMLGPARRGLRIQPMDALREE